MVKMERYCDICMKKIYDDKFYQMQLPKMDCEGNIILSNTEQDVCLKCFEELYWKIGEVKHPGVSFL